MLIKKPVDIPSSEITDQACYHKRREFIRHAGLALAAAAIGSSMPFRHARAAAKPWPAHKSAFSTSEALTPYKDITSYNNFYEFGTDKDEPAKLARNFIARPWALAVEGEVRRPKVFDIDELLKLAPLEERIYRLRCVEGWSMVIPWLGFPLSEIIKRVEPTGRAKYVEFHTLHDPGRMPGQRTGVLDWPYVEGLRLDEAMHPLTLMAVGLYGETLPNQNGAPIRLVVPWKYGFKSAKSIVKIRFAEQQPVSAWMKANPREYGFYSNVNPAVDHPRWSQARERRIGEFLKRKTLMFNGYGGRVARLYSGMDLRRHF